MDHAHFRITAAIAVIGTFAIHSNMALASEETDALQRQLTEVQQQMLHMQQAYQQQIDSLKQRVNDLENQSDQTVSQSSAPPIPGGTSASNSALQIGLSGLFAGGGSSVDNDSLEGLQAGQQFLPGTTCYR